MYSTKGHQLVVNEYFAECLRKAIESEIERDSVVAHGYGHDSAAPIPPEVTRHPAPKRV